MALTKRPLFDPPIVRRAIQDALLGPGEVDPTRVFMLGANSAKAVDGKVQVALSLK